MSIKSRFDVLSELLRKNAPGAYMAAEMCKDCYVEEQFRMGAGAHNVYSISKSVTSCAVGILEAEGKIKDTDTVYKYLSKYFPENYDEKWKTVRLCDVMHHKTGCSAEANIDIDVMDFWADGRCDFLHHVLSQPIIYEPGNGPFIYSDTNYYIISRVVEEIAGVTLGAFLQTRMFDVLKWRGNAWGVCPQNHTLGGTGLFATARDLCAYGLMLACGGEFEGERILTPEWIEKARGERGGYGYGFSNSSDGKWFLTGGAYGQAVYIFPDKKTSVCILGHDMPVDRINKEIIPMYVN